MEKLNVKAVIFDMDGTLIDTEKYFRICWPKTFEHFGYKMTDEQYLSIRSLGKPFVYSYLKEISGDVNFDYDKVIAYRSELMEKMIAERGLQAKKGAEILLEFLNQNGIATAVATASPRERATKYLSELGLKGYFDYIISCHDVKKGKPEPDVYLTACQELKLKPEECLAVEDCPNGVLSASRAGLRVVMVPDQSPVDSEMRSIIAAEKSSLDQIKDLF